MTDLANLESKVDDLKETVNTLANAITKLVLFEERQSVQALAIAVLTAKLDASDQKADATNAKLDMWINRGIGVWAVVGSAGFIWKTFIA